MLRNVVVLGLCLLPAASQAATLEFNGLVGSTCSISVDTNGTLALSGDGLTLGSEEGLALPGVVLILSLGANTIDVAAPTLVTSPAAYDGSNQVLEVAYSGLNGLSGISQAYTSSATSFPAPSIPLSVLTVNNRIVNPDGFLPGQYTTQTVITCQ